MELKKDLVLVVVLALVLPILGFFLVRPEAYTLYRGYSLLVVEDGIEEAKVLASLGALGWDKVLSESTQPVEVSSLSAPEGKPGLESFSLGEVKERLVQGDPRRDSYIEGLGAWFHASQGSRGYRIYYLKGYPKPKDQARIGASLAGLKARAWFPETGGVSSPSAVPAMVLAGIMVGLCFLWKNGRRSLLMLFMLAPLFPLGFKGLDGCLVALMLGLGLFASLPLWTLVFEEYSTRRDLASALRILKLRSLAYLPLGLASAGFLIAKPRFLLSGLLVLLGSLCAGFGLYLLRPSKGRRPSFIPVPIMGKGSQHGRGDPHFRWAAVACVLTLAFSLGYSALGYPRAVQPVASVQGRGATEDLKPLLVPQARVVPGPAQPMPDVALGLQAQDKGPLPNLADWLVHRWRQESLFYRVLSRDVAGFEAVDLPLASGEGPRQGKPDGAWAKSAYRSLGKPSLEALWAKAPGFCQGVLAPLGGSGVRPLAPLEALLYIILMVPPVYGVLRKPTGGFRSRREQH